MKCPKNFSKQHPTLIRIQSNAEIESAGCRSRLSVTSRKRPLSPEACTSDSLFIDPRCLKRSECSVKAEASCSHSGDEKIPRHYTATLHECDSTEKAQGTSGYTSPQAKLVTSSAFAVSGASRGCRPIYQVRQSRWNEPPCFQLSLVRFSVSPV